MKDTKFRILLDIHEVRSQATIPVKVGDVSCKIYITLVEGGKPYKIHENSFGVFTGKKGDNNPIFNNCIIENGIIRYDFTPQTVAAAGVLECEIRIYDEDGGVLTTPSFNIIVDERAVNDSELESAAEFAFLDEIIVNEGRRIENEKSRNEAFNNLGIDLEDDGEVINIIKTDINGSKEKMVLGKWENGVPPVTASASGSAITIESAKAPLQNLKLFGKTTQNGTPTPEAPVPMVSVGDSGSFEVGVYGKNLLNVTKSIAFTNADMVFKNIKCPLKKGETYTLSFFSTIDGANYQFTYTGVSGTDYRSPTIQTSSAEKTVYTFTPIEDVDIVRLYIDGTGSLIECMIEKGGFTGYHECNKQTLTMPYPLRSYGEVQDEIDFARGVLIQKCILLKDFVFNYEKTNVNAYRSEKPYPMSYSGALCNYSVHYRADEGDNTHHYIGGSSVWVFLPKSIDTSVASDIEVLGVLETPIEVPLTETELNAYRHLYTNKGNTTILSEAEAEIEYYTPYGQALGNIHTQVNNDYFKLQQAIITTGGN